MIARILVISLCLGILNTVIGCAVAPPTVPSPTVGPLPYAHLPYATGNRRPDISQPSPYEPKMDEEERQYRRQRDAQEREQERRYQQWEQEQARERDPRYEWMR